MKRMMSVRRSLGRWKKVFSLCLCLCLSLSKPVRRREPLPRSNTIAHLMKKGVISYNLKRSVIYIFLA